MIDELRIKCPSCGLILDVRNSKHEAVKTIMCPGCKKHLTVDFQEKATPKPIPPLYYGQMPITLHEGINSIPLPDCVNVEINVVRINDGSCKCIVQPLSAEHPVMVNNTQLELGDKTLLNKGDQLKVGNTNLVYGKATSPEDVPTANGQLIGSSTIKSPKHPKKHNFFGWPLGIITLIVCACLIIFLWSNNKAVQPVAEADYQENTAELIDTPTTSESHQAFPVQRERHHATEHSAADNQHRGNVSPPSTSHSYGDMNEYDLERLAGNDVAAQYEFGKRLVNTERHALGVSYLRRAAQAGHSGAQRMLDENGW